MEYSDEYANKYEDVNFGKINKLDELHANSTAPNGYTVKSNGTIYNPKGAQVNGVTVFNGAGKGFNVYLGKNIFVDKFSLYQTMLHEFSHIAINIGQGVPYYNDNESHAVIYRTQYKQMQKWGFTGNSLEPYQISDDMALKFFKMDLYNKYALPIIDTYPKLP